MENFSLGISQSSLFILIVLMLWSLSWKAIALWKSARRGQAGWFIFFVFVNSVGVMELIYLFFLGGFGPKQLSELKKKIRRFFQSKPVNDEKLKPGNKNLEEKNDNDLEQRSSAGDLNARKILMERRKNNL